jgi:hypothetical protein
MKRTDNNAFVAKSHLLAMGMDLFGVARAFAFWHNEKLKVVALSEFFRLRNFGQSYWLIAN